MTQVNVMAMRGVEFQDISCDVTVPNDPVARLMYYVYCVLATVDEINSNATTRRLSDYKYFSNFMFCSVLCCTSIFFY